ncbi:hypothetical protein [Bradyrhizobium prioriisuperbiae]|nr:hypothetical protein [Bradyrhizobium prioritasuperba]
MGVLPMVLAFAAGFLTCAGLVIATIYWSFADERVRDTAIDERRNQRTA